MCINPSCRFCDFLRVLLYEHDKLLWNLHGFVNELLYFRCSKFSCQWRFIKIILCQIGSNRDEALSKNKRLSSWEFGELRINFKFCIALSSILPMLPVHLLLDKVFPSSAVIKCRSGNSLVRKAQTNQISWWPSLTSRQCMAPTQAGVNICRITCNGLYSYQCPSSSWNLQDY